MAVSRVRVGQGWDKFQGELHATIECTFRGVNLTLILALIVGLVGELPPLEEETEEEKAVISNEGLGLG